MQLFFSMCFNFFLTREWINEQKIHSNPSLARVLMRWYRKKAIINALFIIFQVKNKFKDQIKI